MSRVRRAGRNPSGQQGRAPETTTSIRDERLRSDAVTGVGAIAQLGERLLCKQEVVGSIPSGSTSREALSSSSVIYRFASPQGPRPQVTPLSDIVKRRSIRASAFDTRVPIEARQGFRVVDQDEAARNLVGGLDRTPSERSRSKLVFLMQCRSDRDPKGF
jgi:hypothetical protein